MEAERFVSRQAPEPSNPRAIRPDTLPGGQPNSRPGCYSFALADAQVRVFHEDL
jgi:hypothetical protein